MAWKQSLQLLSDLLLQVKTEKQMKSILTDLMTPPEVDDVAERILLCKLLLEGNTQRAIAKKLKISVTTINR